jgi:hypothetical protein
MIRILLLTAALAQGGLDFSGKWRLDTDRSDDAEAVIQAGLENTSGRVTTSTLQTFDRLVALSRALTWLEIRQTERDFSLYDDADNVRIYYIDGKKHARETPWGAKLDTVTKWEGAELHIKTDGGDLGEVTEVYSFDGGELRFTVRIKVKNVKDEIAVNSYYTRATEIRDRHQF